METLSPREIRALAEGFVPQGLDGQPAPFGNGHINDTYAFVGGAGTEKRRYILQRINRTAFHHPEEVMENISRVTEHLRAKLSARGGDPGRETLWLSEGPDGKPYAVDSMGEWWRCYRFVENTVTYETTDDPHILREAGACFGRFHDMLSDFDASALYETIPRFHDMPKRFRDFRQAVERDALGRAAGVKKEIEGTLAYAAFPPYLQTRLESGTLPLRVTHNDTKLNNILMDKDTGRGVCVIDLDTVMPGAAAFDFGDAIRTGASTAAEDEPDTSKVRLSLPMYRAFAQGYLGAFGQNLTEGEVASLPMGARLMTMECLMRTLGDYLDGDVYYKIDYPEHNLTRARTQLKMMGEMDAHWDEMTDIVGELGRESRA